MKIDRKKLPPLSLRETHVSLVMRMAQREQDIDVKEEITPDDAIAARRTQLHSNNAKEETSVRKYIIAAHGLGIRSLSLDAQRLLKDKGDIRYVESFVRMNLPLPSEILEKESTSLATTIVVPPKFDPSFEQLRENDMKPKVVDNSSSPEEKTAWRRALNSLIKVLQIAIEHNDNLLMHKMLELAEPEIKKFGLTLIANGGHPSQEMEDMLENITLRMSDKVDLDSILDHIFKMQTVLSNFYLCRQCESINDGKEGENNFDPDTFNEASNIMTQLSHLRYCPTCCENVKTERLYEVGTNLAVHDSSTTDKPLRLVGDLNCTMEYFFPEKITIGGVEFFRIAAIVSEELHDGSTSGRYCLQTNFVSSRAKPKGLLGHKNDFGYLEGVKFSASKTIRGFRIHSVFYSTVAPSAMKTRKTTENILHPDPWPDLMISSDMVVTLNSAPAQTRLPNVVEHAVADLVINGQSAVKHANDVLVYNGEKEIFKCVCWFNAVLHIFQALAHNKDRNLYWLLRKRAQGSAGALLDTLWMNLGVPCVTSDQLRTKVVAEYSVDIGYDSEYSNCSSSESTTSSSDSSLSAQNDPKGERSRFHCLETVMETQTLLRYIAKCSKCREETDLTTDHQNVPKQLLEFMRKIVIKVVWCYKCSSPCTLYVNVEDSGFVVKGSRSEHFGNLRSALDRHYPEIVVISGQKFYRRIALVGEEPPNPHLAGHDFDVYTKSLGGPLLRLCDGVTNAWEKPFVNGENGYSRYTVITAVYSKLAPPTE